MLFKLVAFTGAERDHKPGFFQLNLREGLYLRFIRQLLRWLREGNGLLHVRLFYRRDRSGPTLRSRAESRQGSMQKIFCHKRRTKTDNDVGRAVGAHTGFANISGNDKGLGLPLAETEGFEPSIRFPV